MQESLLHGACYAVGGQAANPSPRSPKAVYNENMTNLPQTNAQRVKLLEEKPPGRLLIHEVYRSVQGESTFAGLPCVFMRLAVCDARCVWCDTPHAFTQGTLWTLDEVIEKVRSYACPVVEITGGEP